MSIKDYKPKVLTGENVEEVEIEHVNKTNTISSKNEKNSPNYKPYKTSTVETPLLYYITGGIGLPTQFYAFRWMLAYPLQKRLPLPGMKKWTYGEALLLLPWALLLWMAIDTTILNPDVEGSGVVAGYPLILMFLTATRTNSLFSFLLGIPFERMLFYHKVSAMASMISGVLHFYVACAVEDAGSGDSGDSGDSSSRDLILLNANSLDNDMMHRHLSGSGDTQYAAFGPDPDLIKFAITGGTNFSGSMIVLAYIGIFITSYILVRRTAFQVFYAFHMIFAIVSLYFGFMYGVNLTIVLIFWIMDIAVRWILICFADSRKQESNVKLLPDNIVELSFPKSFQYNPGQYVFICIPKLSILQWHPFSISSSPHEKIVTIHIKALGGWTKGLARKCSELSILIDGPYGAPSIDLESNRYKLAIFASGGIGATPMFSLCNDLMFKKRVGRDIQKIVFVWSTRASDESEGVDIERNESQLSLPPSFVPDLIQDGNEVVLSKNTTNYIDEGLLFREYYLTGSKKGFEMPMSCVTLRQPDFDSIMKRMKIVALSMGETRIAICVCGPKAMIDQVYKAAIKNSTSGVYFDVHAETFEF